MSKTLLNYFKSDRLECGIDEAGLGCLFGRAYVAAVIWNPEIEPHQWLNDSKKVSPRRREFLYDYILENALDYSIYYVEASAIDTYNILSAKLYGMHRAVDNLNIVPDHILVDGDQFKKYYSKRYLEELKPYAKSPSYSISYMMLISSLPKIVKEKAQKEWDSNKLV